MMKYIGAGEAADLWGVTPRVVRKYCEEGRVDGAVKENSAWKIPSGSSKPERLKREQLTGPVFLTRLVEEKNHSISGGIYHYIQIDFTYNSNHIEGSRLTHDQTRFIFETNTISANKNTAIHIDDLVETANHFRAIDYVIDNYSRQLTENMIKHLHAMLKNGTSDSRLSWFSVGAYKKLENEVGGMTTTLPEDVPEKMKAIISAYNARPAHDLRDILDFHYKFERIHPFQDGNGRVGRLIMFKECLKNGVTPFIIEDDIKLFYYRGLTEWPRDKGYLTGTAEAQQEKFRNILKRFGIKENK